MESTLRLSVTPPQGAPYDFDLDRDEVVIGRASDVDLPLADRFLSRQHARIFRREGHLLVEDLGSRNGTTVNGRRIEGPTQIHPGDVIAMCGSSLVLEDRQAPVGTLPEEDQLSSVTLFRSARDFLEPASQVQLEGDAKALRRYAERLSLLNQVHHALGASMELDGLLELILDGIFRHLQPEECAIFLRQDDGEMVKAASRATVPGGENLLFSRALVREVTEKRVAALVYDAQMDERFAAAQSIMTSGVRSLAAAPLLDGEDVLGMMVIGSRVAVRAYSEEDLELLVTLSAVAAMRLRNLRLAEEAAERHAMEQELALARHIQTNLLPERLPDLADWEIYGGTLPSRTVSGDMYQVLQRADGAECVLMVADVSGKGMAASLLTASLEALSIAPIESGLPADEICLAVSQRLYQRTPPEKYATAFLGILDVESGSLAYTNAGHNPALLVRHDGSVEQLQATGTPLGLLPNAPYSRRDVALSQGDLLAIYTDGVTETFDLDDEEYGTDRLAAFLQDHSTTPLDQIAVALEITLDQFSHGAPPGDDVTLVMIRRR
ncbi:MAG: SpoIIE family protein phosphatase [Thermoanaerobaculia bacterium]|nr:SpoIIE family protein phosphatase [Thermoanaerobaculia bacterium]